jgi:hypothetical protein
VWAEKKKFAVGVIMSNNANIGLKLLNLLELTFVFRNVLVFCHFFLEKKVTKNSRLCRNPAILLGRCGGSEKNSPLFVSKACAL